MLTQVAGATLHRADRLTDAQVTAVRALAERCADTDGVGPLNEDALLGLGAADRTHLLLDDGVAGYAVVADGTVQLMVDPVRRRAGLGAGLAEAVGDPDPDAAAGPASVTGWWAFGDLPGARALAARRGLVVVRELLRLGRPLTDLPPARTLPDHARLRSFRPGHDEAAWLDVNARAFADHPEQGRMTAADLAARMAEDWFDPAGLLLAVAADDPDRVLGFHWTKVTPQQPGSGEVYVLGVDPDAAGGGLGGALLDAGLAHLVDRGATTVDLYVEGDNEPALGLYRRAGFDELARDVMYGEGPR